MGYIESDVAGKANYTSNLDSPSGIEQGIERVMENAGYEKGVDYDPFIATLEFLKAVANPGNPINTRYNYEKYSHQVESSKKLMTKATMELAVKAAAMGIVGLAAYATFANLGGYDVANTIAQNQSILTNASVGGFVASAVAGGAMKVVDSIVQIKDGFNLYREGKHNSEYFENKLAMEEEVGRSR